MRHEQTERAPEQSPTTLRDGRYEGSNEHAFVELRVDRAVSAALSADLYRLGPDARRDWVASVRTAPGTTFARGDHGSLVVAEDDLGGATTGHLTVSSPNGTGETANVVLELDQPLNGLPARTPIAFSVTWASATLRSLGIEIETEQGVAREAPVTFDGRRETLETCLTAAGFEVHKAGADSQIPRSHHGWEMSELHTLMQDFAQQSLTERSWNLHLLLLSSADEPRLLGVMFDETEVLPRQGAAVFADSVRAIPNIDHDRKLIQTSVHELGHALNLAHRFERVVGRADSTSFMNYDWRYKGGNKRDEFWARFAFRFDADELAFLRHGPRSAVIPGGAAFHSIRYWNEGTGGYSPYVPEAPLPGFELSLRGPQSGNLFAFAQPIFLEVELTNRTGQELELPAGLLDPKSGFLEILVRRTHGTSTRSLAETTPFQPILQRCYDMQAGAADRVPDGGSIRNNVNLTYGTSGFPFADPGAYEITALLAVSDPQNQRELIVRSPVLPIRVAAPQTVDEDRDAMQLFRDDVGVYIALGGNRRLAGAHDALAEVVERRRGDVSDPVVAAIVRAQGLDARRSYVRYRAGDFQQVAAEPDRAAELLGSLDDDALCAFDRTTAEGTRRLADAYRD